MNAIAKAARLPKKSRPKVPDTVIIILLSIDLKKLPLIHASTKFL